MLERMLRPRAGADGVLLKIGPDDGDDGAAGVLRHAPEPQGVVAGLARGLRLAGEVVDGRAARHHRAVAVVAGRGVVPRTSGAGEGEGGIPLRREAVRRLRRPADDRPRVALGVPEIPDPVVVGAKTSVRGRGPVRWEGRRRRGRRSRHDD